MFIGEDGREDRLGGEDGIGRMHAILVLLGSSAPFEDFILSTLYNSLYRSYLDKSISIYLLFSCRNFIPYEIYIYICMSFSVDDSRANFLAFLFLFRADPEKFGGGFRDSKPPCMWPVQGCRDNTRSAMLVTFVYSWSAGLLYAGLPRL